MEEIQRVKNIKIDNPRLRFGIDRDEENRDVIDFVRTGDQNIFNRIYYRRKPTIEYLAKKYNWLTEDAASEIRIVLVRTVNSYGKNGKNTDFNTFFYSSVKNHFSNIAKKRYRKKRTTIDGTDPMNRTVTLDSCIGDDDGSSLHEFISNEDRSMTDNFDFESLLFKISKGNKYISDILFEIKDLTRREIIKESDLIFNFSFPLISGDAELDISGAIGIPSDSYNVMNTFIENRTIKSIICINGKRFIDHIAKSFSNCESEMVENRGF